MLPLHYGKAPPWLFSRMKLLGRAIYEVIEIEFGKDEFLRRMSDPFWFQAFGCVLGFDWHSSGLTTTVCGALKESLDPEQHGIAVLGGKGSASRNTPEEIQAAGEKFNISYSKTMDLVHASRMAAKVDNTAIQDGYQLYHHSFFLTEDGKWAVIQQGLNDSTSYARRYHWLSENVNSFINEPHSAICCDKKEERVLNTVANESKESRNIMIDIVQENPERIKRHLIQLSLSKVGFEYGFTMSSEHEIDVHLYKKFIDLNEFKPRTYEELLAFKGVGPKTIRALALISDLIYGTPPSWKDPVKYSFSHGGKDGFPYPVDKLQYDKSIELLKTAIENARINDYEKLRALDRLKTYARIK
jgi:hypothetical protein